MFGRHGELGIVVDVARDEADRGSAFVVRGGVSDSLTYHVSSAHVRAVSWERRIVLLNVDVTDFHPRLQADGTIELRMPSGGFSG